MNFLKIKIQSRKQIEELFKQLRQIGTFSEKWNGEYGDPFKNHLIQRRRGGFVINISMEDAISDILKYGELVMILQSSDRVAIVLEERDELLGMAAIRFAFYDEKFYDSFCEIAKTKGWML